MVLPDPTITQPFVLNELPLLHGFDLNHWKGKQPGSLFVDRGAFFLLAKATEGEAFVDGTFDWYHGEATAYALPFGGYHYWRAISDPVKQATHFHKTAFARSPRPFVDVEKTNNINLFSKSEAAARAKATLEAVADLWGVTPVLYSSKYAIKDMLGDPSWVGDYDLWVASYFVSTPSLPAYATDWRLWQYTDRYQIEGKHYDANWFKGDTLDLLEFFGVSDQTEPPAPSFPTVPIGSFTVNYYYRNLRDKPGTADSKVIGKATQGSVIPYFAEQGDWKQLAPALWAWKAAGE